MKKTIANPESCFCRVVMAMRGIDEHELSRLTGFALGSIFNVLTCHGHYPEVKAAIERALDCRIWASPAQFREHQRRYRGKKP